MREISQSASSLVPRIAFRPRAVSRKKPDLPVCSMRFVKSPAAAASTMPPISFSAFTSAVR